MEDIDEIPEGVTPLYDEEQVDRMSSSSITPFSPALTSRPAGPLTEKKVSDGKIKVSLKEDRYNIIISFYVKRGKLGSVTSKTGYQYTLLYENSYSKEFTQNVRDAYNLVTSLTTAIQVIQSLAKDQGLNYTEGQINASIKGLEAL